MSDTAAFIRAYLDAIERDELVGREDEWYTADAVQIEWPNKLNPNGVTRNLEQLREAGERGRQIVARQWYEVVSIVADGDMVAVETIFRATFRIALPDLPAGEVMEARFAMFFEMSDGRIRRHRTYDCFMPRAGDTNVM
jgi:ketosteroid isomerase-like protein